MRVSVVCLAAVLLTSALNSDAARAQSQVVWLTSAGLEQVEANCQLTMQLVNHTDMKVDHYSVALTLLSGAEEIGHSDFLFFDLAPREAVVDTRIFEKTECQRVERLRFDGVISCSLDGELHQGQAATYCTTWLYHIDEVPKSGEP